MVQYSNNLIQDLERSLGYAFHQRFLRLTRPPGTRQRPSEFHIRLDVDSRGSPVTTALEDDGSEPLVMEIMLPGGRHSSFWFSFVAAFRQEQSEKQNPSGQMMVDHLDEVVHKYLDSRGDDRCFRCGAPNVGGRYVGTPEPDTFPALVAQSEPMKQN